MKLTDEGEYVFLELNPMGQFLYIEILAGLPLTAAMAELLVLGRGAAHESWQTPGAVFMQAPAGGDGVNGLSGGLDTECVGTGDR